MSEAGSSLQPGALVADTYEVASLLGRGGMGEVWLANHRRLSGKKVALKVLRIAEGTLSDEARARFRREAEVAARLTHPHIVAVHDFNTLPSGDPYLVMEFLEGESLAARARRGPLTLEAAQKVIREVGAALVAAHGIGVIHRDLKPDNIFIVNSPMGEVVKVLDFGISKLQGSQSVVTQEQSLIGTPQYMAPEQVTGPSSKLTPAADVFALGCIAYEIVSGIRPFEAENIPKLLFTIAYEPHQPLSNRVQGLPDEVYRAVEAALVKDPATRCPDAATFVHWFCGETLAPRPSPVAPTMARPAPSAGAVDSVSMMLGKTAATPRPPGSGRDPVVVEPALPSHVPAAAPSAGKGLWVGVAVAALVVLAGGLLLFLRTPPPPPSTPVSAPVAAAPTTPVAPAPSAPELAPTPAAPPAPAPAPGPTAAADKPAEEAQAPQRPGPRPSAKAKLRVSTPAPGAPTDSNASGAPKAPEPPVVAAAEPPPPPVPAAPVAVVPSASEKLHTPERDAVNGLLENIVGDPEYLEPKVQKLLGTLRTKEGISRAWAGITMVRCAMGQVSARDVAPKITLASDRKDAHDFCEARGVHGVARP